jgi:hypothetical protein
MKHYGIEIPEGSQTLPSLSFIANPDTGFYLKNTNTLAITLDGDDAWRVVRRGGSPLIVGSPDELATIGVDLHVVNDGAGDSQIRIETTAAGKDSILKFITATSNWALTNKTSTDALVFQHGGIDRFQIENDGTLSILPGGSPAYENLITANDDIPNKKYVDDAILASTSGGSPQFADINLQTGTSYTTVLADAEKFIILNNSSPVTVLIPKNDVVPYPDSTKLNFIQEGTGQVTIEIIPSGSPPGSPVGSPLEDTLNVESSLTTTLKGQYAVATAVKIAATKWVLYGNLATV